MLPFSQLQQTASEVTRKEEFVNSLNEDLRAIEDWAASQLMARNI